MHGLDEKRLLIGSLKLRQKKYFKIFVFFLLIVFNFRFTTPIQSNEALVVTPQNLHKQSFQELFFHLTNQL